MRSEAEPEVANPCPNKPRGCRKQQLTISAAHVLEAAGKWCGLAALVAMLRAMVCSAAPVYLFAVHALKKAGY
jgi:hypothetical protein